MCCAAATDGVDGVFDDEGEDEEEREAAKFPATAMPIYAQSRPEIWSTQSTRRVGWLNDRSCITDAGRPTICSLQPRI